jgi:hypothetical protein
MRIAKPTKTVITKQPNGSYTIRDRQSYVELLKEVNKGMNEYKQFRNRMMHLTPK